MRTGPDQGVLVSTAYHFEMEFGFFFGVEDGKVSELSGMVLLRWKVARMVVVVEWIRFEALSLSLLEV